MIDEKLLDRLDQEHELLVQPREFDKELRKLARLGLWAKKHGIPIITHYTSHSIEAADALLALPEMTYDLVEEANEKQ